MDISDFKIINEFKNDKNTDEIPIHIYTLAVKDINLKHSQNYDLVAKLRLENKNECIVFYENFIASFKEISLKHQMHEYKTIDVDNKVEKNLLERLIKEDIKINVNKERYRTNRDGIFEKIPAYDKENIIGYRRFLFDVSVEKNKDIIIGYNLSLSFEYKNTLLEEKDIKRGTLVKDFYKGGTYEYLKEADFSIKENNNYMFTSIFNYYKNKNEEYVLKNLDLNMKAVLVKSHEKIFPYIPTRLKKVLKYENLPKSAKDMTKSNPTDKMKELNFYVEDITKTCKYVRYISKNKMLKNLGYTEIILPKPNFKFRNNFLEKNITKGLFNFGLYENKDVEISYFLDPLIVKDKYILKEVEKFDEELRTYSKKMKINLMKNVTRINFKSINIENEFEFEQSLRKIVRNYSGIPIFILTDENGQKYYKSIKRLFGNKEKKATQFVYISTVKKVINLKEEYKSFIYTNILLGIYSKIGLQPFVLNNKLSADCYIGLDVSRIDGMNFLGVVQVVGKDGKILKTRTFNVNQNGEKIDESTLKDIVLETKYTFEKEYNKKLEHIVFHRDGLNNEQLEILEKITKSLNIKFDYVEITKNVSRRIAALDENSLKLSQDGKINNSMLKLKTEIGHCYIKDNYAYMITTDPKFGMAQPIRIKSVFGNSKMIDIITDIYNLSYMHIASTHKSRLPVTTYYADLSSTCGNLGFIPFNEELEGLYFV